MPETIYSLDQINDWESKLAGLAQKPRTRFSKKQAVEAMIDAIELALQSHPYDEVAENLKGWGLDIAPGSLKQYVNAYRREHSSEAVGSVTKRSSRKGKKNGSKKRLPATEEKATSVAETTAPAASRKKVTEGATKKGKGSASEKTPKGFIDMPEDL